MSKSIKGAAWIGADEKISSPLFRKQFHIKKQVVSAILDCTGLGYFEAYINNNKISDDVLVPAQTDYDKRELKSMSYPMQLRNNHRIMYLSYDITDMLTSGDNVLGIWLGNGFYRQLIRDVEGDVSYGNPKTIACLKIKYIDDSYQYIMTDDNEWYCNESPITFNNVFAGEVYDANLEIDDWCMPNVSLDKWQNVKLAKPPVGRLVLQDCPTDKVQESYEAKLLYHEGNKYIYDINQNIAGWVNLTVTGEKGQTVDIRFAGNVNKDCSLNFESTGGKHQIQKLQYILNDKGVQSYRPKFSWVGFRYIEVTTDAKIDDIKAEFVGTHLEKTGDFTCSNELFNRLYDLYIKTQRANMHGCITSDCPHRERLSYTGDGQLVTEPIMLNFDGYSFIRKWITDLKDGQNIDTGHVPHTVPFMGGGGGPAWGSAIVLVPWRYYLQTGDIEVLKEMYQPMKRWMEYLETKTDNDFIIHREEKHGWCLGDWCAPGEMEIPEDYVNTCIYAHITKLMIEISEALKLEADEYISLKKNIKKAIVDKWYDDRKKSFSIGKQGANALALWAEVVPEEKEEDVAATMAHHIIDDCDGHLDTGIIATPILLDMLTDYGYVDMAYEIMNKKTYPSFGYMLENGATTLWERFEKKDSDNHPMFGTYTSWFIKRIVGINPDKENAGYKNIIIKPEIPKDLSYAYANVRTINNENISVKWEKNGDEVIFEVDVPENSSYEFIAPDGYRTTLKYKGCSNLPE